jgi:GT2 family glycosyltransferase
MPIRISVIVPTHNRKNLLLQLLESMFRQSLPSEEFEIIVVSDGATDGTSQSVRKLYEEHPHLRLIEQVQSGPGAARNAGARAAQGPYLAFTDDDCLAGENWLEELLQAFQETGVAGAQGRTTTDRSARSPLTHQIEVLNAWPAAVPTCNAAYRKDVFNKIGGFDEAFKFPHNEDADLAWRVEELGRIVFAPRAHIIHPPRRDRFWKRARWVRGLESDFLLFCKSPDKYRKYVSPSPWQTIYWNVFVMDQVRMAKSSCRYLIKPFRPHHFIAGLGLVLARWFNLIRFLPEYVKAQKFYSSDVAARRVKAQSPAASQ